MNSQFFEKVKEMRTMQQDYFRRISHAKKARTPEAYDSAKRSLVLSKHLENQVDEMIANIDKDKMKNPA